MRSAEEVGAVFAAEYKDCNSMQTRVNLLTLEAHWATICAKKCILELGCGSGYIAHFMAEQLPEATVDAVDISSELITSAKQKYSRNNLKFEVSDATQLAAIKKYDLVVCFFLLHFIGDRKDFFKRIMRSLTPLGEVIIVVPLEDDCMLKTRKEVLAELVKSDSKRFSQIPPLNGIARDTTSYREMIRDNQRSMSCTMREVFFDPQMTVQDFTQFYRGIGVELRLLGLTEAEKTAHIEKVVAKMPRRANGQINFTLRYFELIVSPAIILTHRLWSQGSTQPELSLGNRYNDDRDFNRPLFLSRL